MSYWYRNGQPVDSVGLDDRAVQYGDGVFETIAIRNGDARFCDDHLARLRLGCERLGLQCPPPGTVRAELNAALVDSPVPTDHAIAKVIATAGGGPRGYQRPSGREAAVFIGLFPGQPLPSRHYRDGVAVRICATRLAIQPQLAGIKSLNRLEQVLARAEWRDDQVFEGLMLDTDRRLICGTMSNVFIVRQNSISTPAITRCGVSGVMRGRLIAMLEETGMSCEIRDIEAAELLSADEVFLSNSQFGVLPVNACRGTRWRVGALTRELMALASRRGVTECDP